ncbi:ATP-binding protein [Caldisalinibacter kiritimatiensis]|uniref:histidine kinase n=1 Tax=Caldisalinibacter kiritimatiensis TaxID=1304284 RepID=R1CBP1_9FIRM|nr:ATP-binding protein [Caldisalinibacter kiritimatiensis]EOC99739.1 sensory transduction histidine kinase [Caldisalinibacter kiritimatiensis]
MGVLIFINSLGALLLGAYALKLDVKNKVNRLFFYLCFNLAFWMISYGIAIYASNESTYWTWYKISSIPFCVYPALITHFFLVLAKRKFKSFHPLLYLPPVIFIYQSLKGVLTLDNVEKSSIGWYGVMKISTIWHVLFIVYGLSYIAFSIYIIYKWGKETELKREKSQSRYLLSFFLILTIIHLILSIVNSPRNIIILKLPIVMMLWEIGIGYCVLRYKIIDVTPNIAIDKIVNSIDLMIIIDEKGNIIKINEKTAELLSYPHNEIIGKSIYDISKDKSKIINFIQKLKRGFKNNCNRQFTFITKDNELVFASVSLSVLKDKFGDILGYLFVGQNINRIKQLEREIYENKLSREKQKLEKKNELLKKIEEYNKLKSEFFENISHEFRTPLNIIIGTLKLYNIYLERNSHIKDIDKLLKYTDIMRQNSYRLVRLVNNVIDIIEIDGGFVKLNFVNCNIISLVEDITLSVAEYAEEKGRNILFDTEIEEKIIACDPDKIERIILNLLSNAIKFTSNDDLIFVSIKQREENIIIVVEDTGVGIPKSKQDVVFDRFRQADELLTRGNEGSGIGLSIVKSLVEMHEGTIEIESEYNEGCKFIITIPDKIVEYMEDINSSVAVTTDNRIERISIEFSDIYS